MPARGFKAVTIREMVYELARRVVEEDQKRLEARHRSVTDLIETAVVWYVKQHYPKLYERLKRELERSES